MKEVSAYQLWMMDKYQGSSPKEAIDHILNKLLTDTRQFSLPVKISVIAKKIGVNPKPLYINQPYDGSLIMHENAIRIAFKKRPEGNYYDLSPGERFAYAHELIHCLAYDFNSVPNQRVAPLPKSLEEEHLCNYGAKRILLPPKIIQDYFEKGLRNNVSYIELIKEIATASGCTIPMVAIEIFKENLIPAIPNSLFILSQNSSGYQKRNVIKPRCIVGAYFDATGKKFPFLSSQQGLQHIKSNQSINGKWSLLDFFDHPEHNRMLVTDEYIKNDKTGKAMIISGSHNRLTEGSLIWSEMTVIIN